MNNDRELLLVTGLPRSGTTWLEGILNAHPEIFLYHEIDDAESKEKAVFSAINHNINAENENEYKNALLDGVEHLFDTSFQSDRKKNNAKFVGFKTVGRFAHPKVLNWVRKTLDYPKTVFIMRHPCGQVSSQLRLPKLRNRSANDIINDERWLIDSLDGALKDGASVEECYALLWTLANERVLHDNQDTKNFFTIVYEDLCKDPMSCSKALYDFLGLEMHKSVYGYLEKSTNPERNIIARILSKRFYSTTKNPLQSAYKWQKELTEKQQKDIMSIASASKLMKYWE